VVLTTQDLDEVDHLADRIAVIDRGKVIAEGTSSELKASVGAGVAHIRLRDPDQRSEARSRLARYLGAPVHLDADPPTLVARAGDPERVALALMELSRSGVAVTEFSLGQPSLDEVFLALTGHPVMVNTLAQEDVA
jgi:ABC-2 type transport system ATP-binding protein